MDLSPYIRDVDAVVSCLGHNLTRKGIWGREGRWLCYETTRKCCETIKSIRPAEPVKYVVISTEGVDQPDDGKDPPRGVLERFVLWLLKHLLPPHADNMANIAYLGRQVFGGNNPCVDFCAVRPSDLTDDEESAYTLHERLQNGIFNAGKTSRANVGRFMADLVTEPEVWKRWRNTYPHQLNTVDLPRDATL